MFTFKKLWQRSRHQVCAVLCGIVLISSLCVVPAEATSGNMLYNGVELPDINSVWDKENYPYASIAFYATGEELTCELLFSENKCVTDAPTVGSTFYGKVHVYMFTVLQDLADFYGAVCGEWFEIGVEMDGYPWVTRPNWANYDVLNPDGTTYLAASDPIPLDGGGVESPPAEGGSGLLDFSKATLRVFDSNVLGTKADWACRWYGVPNLDPPDNVYYFFEFSASSAGHNVSSVPFFMGSNEICPDGEYEFFIQGLQPSTTYTGVLKLVYNTTGEWSGFTDTGVTYSFSFTTAESDPVTPDEPEVPDIPVDPDEPDVPGGGSGGTTGDSQDVIGAIKDSNKDVIDAIKDSSVADREWMDEQYSSGVGSLPDDVADFDGLVGNLDVTEEAYKNEAFARFQEISSSFNGFDGSVGSGISLAGTLFSRFFSALGSYKIVYTFPLLLAVAFVAIGRLGRSSFKHERSDHDQFLIDGW